jgi:hypothetical protein
MDRINDHDVGCAGVFRQRAEKSLQGLNAAGGCADQDNDWLAFRIVLRLLSR